MEETTRLLRGKKSYLSSLNTYGLTLSAIVIAVGIYLWAYHTTLFNFLTGGDLYFMVWAHNAMSHPEVLLEKYYRPYPIEETMFYRPNLYAVLFLGYKLWKNNGLYFRLINVTADILCGLMLGLVVFTLSQKSIKNTNLWNHPKTIVWALMTFILFILFPSHSESVNWVTVVTNPLVSFFFLSAFWCYIQWRTESKTRFLILSIAAAILAFLTKETAVALPPTIFIYELLFLKGARKHVSVTESSYPYLKLLYQCLTRTAFYWLILVLYFGLRKILLGDFIAGYPDLVCHQSLSGWLLGFKGIFIPINLSVIGTHSLTFKIWHVYLCILIGLTVSAIMKSDQHTKKIACFLLVWFFLTLVPNYKIFPTFINADDNNRIVYLSTGPLSALLTYGLAMFSIENAFVPLVRFFALTFFLLAAHILYNHNTAWAKAGNWTNKVVQEVNALYQNVIGDPIIYVIGFSSSNPKFIFDPESITQKPIMNRKLHNCLRLEDNSFLSNGFIRESAENSNVPISLVYWDSASETLKPIRISKKNWAFTKKWQGKDLKQIISISPLPFKPPPIASWLPDGTLELTSNENKIGFLVLNLKLSELPCSYTDFLALKVQFKPSKEIASLKGELLFTNAIARSYSEQFSTCSTPIKSISGTQELIFPLANIWNWSLGGRCKGIRVVLPIEHSIKIYELLVPQTQSLVPHINFNVLRGDHPGQLRLGTRGLETGYINYDARSIKGAKQIVLEANQVATAADGIFDRHKIRKSFLFKKLASNPSGRLPLNKAEFPAEPAIYKAHVEALNATGFRTGFPSNDFFIRTDY